MLYNSWNLEEWYLLPNDADSRKPKSYYSKAKISRLFEYMDILILSSYDTPVAAIYKSKGKDMGMIFTSVERWNSDTTVRHVQSFFNKYRMPVGNKQFLEETYQNRFLSIKIKNSVIEAVSNVEQEQQKHWRYYK